MARRDFVIPIAMEGLALKRIWAISSSATFVPAGYWRRQSRHAFSILSWSAVPAMRLTTSFRLVSGFPRRFLPMKENSRCSILFHFAGSRREMAHRNGESGFVGQPLQLQFPQPHARPIAAAAICRNEEAPGLWTLLPTQRMPPPPDSFHGKRRRVVVYPHAHPSDVLGRIEDAAWRQHASSGITKSCTRTFRDLPSVATPAEHS